MTKILECSTEIGINLSVTEDCFAADLSGVELTNFNEI